MSREKIDIRRIDSAELRARKYEQFVKTPTYNLLNRLAWRAPLILKGAKGAGKTMLIEQWAAENDVPFLRKSCTSSTGDRQLLGSNILKSFEESYFVLGVLPAAIDVANETGRCVLVLEEINALNEEAQKVLNGVADYRREVDLTHISAVYRLRDPVVVASKSRILTVEPSGEYASLVVLWEEETSTAIEHIIPTALLEPYVKTDNVLDAGTKLSSKAKLWIVGTMNPSTYGGTYDLNEDLRSRFQFVEVDYMDEQAEQNVLLQALGSSPPASDKVFVTNLLRFAKETRGGQYRYALSLRDLEQAVEAYLAFDRDPRLTLRLLSGKFDTEVLADVYGRYMSIFQLDIRNVRLT